MEIMLMEITVVIPFVDIGTKRASSVSHTRLFYLFPVTRFLYLPYIVYIKFLRLNIG